MQPHHSQQQQQHPRNHTNINNGSDLHSHRHHHSHNTSNSATSDTSSTSFHQRFDFSQLKARLPELNCLHNLQRYWQQHNGANSNDPNDPTSGQRDGDGGVGNSFYANNILGYTFGYQFSGGKDATASNNNNNNTDSLRETPLQKFYRHQQQKKMPAFRGRRGWCGCFQVS